MKNSSTHQLSDRERVLCDLAVCLGRSGAANTAIQAITEMTAMELIELIAPNGVTFKTSPRRYALVNGEPESL